MSQYRLSVGWITLTIGSGIAFLMALRGQQPFSSALGYEPLIAILMVLGIICLVLR
ncbi:MAG TPA: hypothetical protein PLD25_19435 [Chloroflexota bacterium]|nr:hypothetical protein [Chloroflexota bacterium]HUM69130.1 hypothetical protein [Chloroflexota bacterium]